MHEMPRPEELRGSPEGILGKGLKREYHTKAKGFRFPTFAEMMKRKEKLFLKKVEKDRGISD